MLLLWDMQDLWSYDTLVQIISKRDMREPVFISFHHFGNPFCERKKMNKFFQNAKDKIIQTDKKSATVS